MSEWISIKDRMPEKDGRYLVYEYQYGWIGVSSVRKGKFDDVAATHWMQLPPKPLEEK